MNRESIMTALYNLLVGALVTSFTGDTHGTVTIDNLSSTKNLFIGLPVFGPGIPKGATIAAIGTSSITLSQAATASAVAQAFASGFQTTSRRLKHWGQVNDFPALFLVDGENDYADRSQIVLPKITLEPSIWAYSNLGEDPNYSPSIALNNLLDAFDAVLKPTGSDLMVQRQTLGRQVQHCWIQGRVIYDPGYLDSIAKITVPLNILVPF